MGAAFNRQLTREGSRISAYETKAVVFRGLTHRWLTWARPRWARQWENYGEDAYLNAEMGRESVLGFQGETPTRLVSNHVAACLETLLHGIRRAGERQRP